MDPIVALVITITGCVILVGFITLLAFRFAKINKILKEHGETLFKKDKTNTNIKKDEKVVVYVRDRGLSAETGTIESQKEDMIRESKAKGYNVIPADQVKTLEDLKEEGVEIITLEK